MIDQQIVKFSELEPGDYFTSLNIPDEVGTCIVANKVFSGLVVIINDRSDIVGPGHFLWEKDVRLISKGNDVKTYSWTNQLL